MERGAWQITAHGHLKEMEHNGATDTFTFFKINFTSFFQFFNGAY